MAAQILACPLYAAWVIKGYTPPPPFYLQFLNSIVWGVMIVGHCQFIYDYKHGKLDR